MYKYSHLLFTLGSLTILYKILKNKIQFNVPKIIHQIWFYGDEMPNQFTKNLLILKNYNTDFDYLLWDENKIKELCIKLKLENIYDNLENDKEKFEFAKIIIMYQYGGLYIDLNFECLKNFEPLLGGNTFKIGKDNTGKINNCVWLSTKNHIVLKNCIAIIKNNNIQKDIQNIFLETVSNFQKNIIIFDSNIFHPIKKNINNNLPYNGDETKAETLKEYNYILYEKRKQIINDILYGDKNFKKSYTIQHKLD